MKESLECKSIFNNLLHFKMGTWALPQTVKQAKELQKLVAKPLSPKVAEDKLYNLLGDDDLLDLIEAEKENAVKAWNKEAYKICQNICKSLEELFYIPY